MDLKLSLYVCTQKYHEPVLYHKPQEPEGYTERKQDNCLQKAIFLFLGVSFFFFFKGLINFLK